MPDCVARYCVLWPAPTQHQPVACSLARRSKSQPFRAGPAGSNTNCGGTCVLNGGGCCNTTTGLDICPFGNFCVRDYDDPNEADFFTVCCALALAPITYRPDLSPTCQPLVGLQTLICTRSCPNPDPGQALSKTLLKAARKGLLARMWMLYCIDIPRHPPGVP